MCWGWPQGHSHRLEQGGSPARVSTPSRSSPRPITNPSALSAPPRLTRPLRLHRDERRDDGAGEDGGGGAANGELGGRAAVEVEGVGATEGGAQAGGPLVEGEAAVGGGQHHVLLLG